ncbi:hypothetical protein SNOG_08099 [Parastagonospora nodorum SN15]|uniref:Uncharacterized protein n=1 Tax=Phaeosphaeria nodorum (strain SN15 / ATCC MYA-4574 / FGSC 10173) TaxID=321614 RepID=Q0UJG5_PHANO|nr:hypothetical protein SNOG_08099 [Parastagonospora nodorum SN15]EAT84375.1 hypothetical protein SNOG_08099 [Parastagonospora nodorum SN15]
MATMLMCVHIQGPTKVFSTKTKAFLLLPHWTGDSEALMEYRDSRFETPEAFDAHHTPHCDSTLYQTAVKDPRPPRSCEVGVGDRRSEWEKLPVRRRTGAMSNQKRKADGHVEDLSSIAVESESRPTSALWATLPRSTNGLHPATKPGKSSASQSGSGRDQRLCNVNDEASIDALALQEASISQLYNPKP